MNTDINTTISSATANYTAAPVKPKEASEEDNIQNSSAAKESTGTAAAAYGEAAVYEKSAEKEDKLVSISGKKDDRTAIIEQLQADAERQQSQLLDIVRKTMQGQGKAIGQADDVWKFLAGGDFTVDAATKAKAQADIADDGYWGVEQTSDRILDFAKALAGDDPEKADKMLEAFKKGYEEATKTWGKELPDLTKRTYDSVLQKFDDWKNSANKTTETASTQAAEQNAAAAADVTA